MSTYNFLEAAHNCAEPVGGLHLYVTLKTYSTWGTPPLFQKGEFLYCQSWVILLSEDKSESAHGHYICVVPSIIRDEAAGNISSSIKFIYVDIYENQFDEVDGSILWADRLTNRVNIEQSAWYLLSIGWYWLIYDGTGSVQGSTGRYLVVLGQ